MVLGTYIVYYKALIKVDTVKQIQRMAFYVMVIYGVIGLVHTILVILCTTTAEYENKRPENGLTDDEIKSKGSVNSMVSSIFELLFFTIHIFMFFMAYTLSKSALKTMLVFHDYLINYRLTPRSRILRKHLPRLTMVIEEEESEMEQSSIADRSVFQQSNSRAMSLS